MRTELRKITGRWATGLAVGVVALLLAAGCDGSGSGKQSASGPASTPAPPPTTGPAPASTSALTLPAASVFPADPSAPAHQFYLSIGDSYAAGYQPTSARQGATTRNGFAYQVAAKSKAKGYDYTLVNFGCSGATTASVLRTAGCATRNLGPGATSYSPKTQVAAAEQFLTAHRGQVGLITVAVGGNDIIDCGASANAVGCLTKALGTVQTNLKGLLSRLRAAAGSQTRIVGITYPDVLLGDELSKDATRRSTAKLSVFAFQSLINPQLKDAYEAVGGKFVDVTEATGGYGSLTAQTTLPPYGRIPVPVAQICRLTYYCQYQDIHPRTPGYALIAGLVVGTLPHH